MALAARGQAAGLTSLVRMYLKKGGVGSAIIGEGREAR